MLCLIELLRLNIEKAITRSNCGQEHLAIWCKSSVSFQHQRGYMDAKAVIAQSMKNSEAVYNHTNVLPSDISQLPMSLMESLSAPATPHDQSGHNPQNLTQHHGKRFATETLASALDGTHAYRLLTSSK